MCSAKFRKHLSGSLLFNKVAGWKPLTLLKEDPSTGDVLTILQNFLEHLFYERPVNSSFCILPGLNEHGAKFT